MVNVLASSAVDSGFDVGLGEKKKVISYFMFNSVIINIKDKIGTM